MYEKIYTIVARIPPGYVASYGQVSQAAGFFRGGRMVGWALRALPPDSPLPWHRVVNQKAMISIINPHIPKSRQQMLLEAENLEVREEKGCLYVKNPRWWIFD